MFDLLQYFFGGERQPREKAATDGEDRTDKPTTSGKSDSGGDKKSSSGGKGGFGAKAGEIIRGNLARGGDGKFTSAGNAAASAAKKTAPKPASKPSSRSQSTGAVNLNKKKPAAASAKRATGAGSRGGKSDAEKKAEAAQKKAEREAERAKKLAERTAEQEKKKAEREAEKAKKAAEQAAKKADADAKKAARDAEKEKKRAERESERAKKLSENKKGGGGGGKGGGKGKDTPTDKTSEYPNNRRLVASAIFSDMDVSERNSLMDSLARIGEGEPIDENDPFVKKLEEFGLMRRRNGVLAMTVAGRAVLNASNKGQTDRARDILMRAKQAVAAQPQNDAAPQSSPNGGSEISADTGARAGDPSGLDNASKNTTDVPATKKADVMKKEVDGLHPASHYLVVEDPDAVTTWHLRVRNTDGSIDPNLMGAAWAALHGGYRGNRYEGPQKEAALRKLTALYESTGNATPDQQQSDVVRGKSMITVVKDAAGNYRWVSLSSNAYQDRHKEIVTKAALERDCARADADGMYGPLLWWHTPVKLGDCDYNAMCGRFLVESGTFVSKEVALAFARNQEPLQVSIAFLPRIDEPDSSGAFTDIRRVERSVMPAGRAANDLTGFYITQENNMAALTPQKQKELQSLIGDDLLSSLLETVDAREKAADEAGIVSKADDMPDDEMVMEDDGGDAEAIGFIGDMTWDDLKPLLAEMLDSMLAPILETKMSANQEDVADMVAKEVGAVASATQSAVAAESAQHAEHIARLEQQITVLQQSQDVRKKEAAQASAAAQAQIDALALQLKELTDLQPSGSYRASVAEDTVDTPAIIALKQRATAESAADPLTSFISTFALGK